jgi:hypothetical protein
MANPHAINKLSDKKESKILIRAVKYLKFK